MDFSPMNLRTAATKTFTFEKTRVSFKIKLILCEMFFLFSPCLPLPPC